jgi:hypothetical protein
VAMMGVWSEDRSKLGIVLVCEGGIPLVTKNWYFCGICWPVRRGSAGEESIVVVIDDFGKLFAFWSC